MRSEVPVSLFVLCSLWSVTLFVTKGAPRIEVASKHCEPLPNLDQVAMNRLKSALLWYQVLSTDAEPDLERLFESSDRGWDGPYVLRWRVEDRSGTPVIYDLDLRDPFEFRLAVAGLVSDRAEVEAEVGQTDAGK